MDKYSKWLKDTSKCITCESFPNTKQEDYADCLKCAWDAGYQDGIAVGIKQGYKKALAECLGYNHNKEK